MTVFNDQAAPVNSPLAIAAAGLLLKQVPFATPANGMTPPAVAFRFDLPFFTMTPPPAWADPMTSVPTAFFGA